MATVFHLTVRDPSMPGMPGAHDHRHVYEDEDEANAAHSRAKAAGFEAELVPVEGSTNPVTASRCGVDWCPEADLAKIAAGSDDLSHLEQEFNTPDINRDLVEMKARERADKLWDAIRDNDERHKKSKIAQDAGGGDSGGGDAGGATAGGDVGATADASTTDAGTLGHTCPDGTFTHVNNYVGFGCIGCGRCGGAWGYPYGRHPVGPHQHHKKKKHEKKESQRAFGPDSHRPKFRPLSPEETAMWDAEDLMRREIEEDVTGEQGRDCYLGNHNSCSDPDCRCAHHNPDREFSGACAEGDHADCEMSHGKSKDDCWCPQHGVAVPSRRGATKSSVDTPVCRNCGQELSLSSDVSPVDGQALWKSPDGRPDCYPIRHRWQNRHDPVSPDDARALANAADAKEFLRAYHAGDIEVSKDADNDTATAACTKCDWTGKLWGLVAEHTRSHLRQNKSGATQLQDPLAINSEWKGQVRGPEELEDPKDAEEWGSCEYDDGQTSVTDFLGKKVCENHLRFALEDAPQALAKAQQGIASTTGTDRLGFENAVQKIKRDINRGQKTLKEVELKKQLQQSGVTLANTQETDMNECERCGVQATHEFVTKTGSSGLLCGDHAESYELASKVAGHAIKVFPFIEGEAPARVAQHIDLTGVPKCKCGHPSDTHEANGDCNAHDCPCQVVRKVAAEEVGPCDFCTRGRNADGTKCGQCLGSGIAVQRTRTDEERRNDMRGVPLDDSTRQFSYLHDAPHQTFSGIGDKAKDVGRFLFLDQPGTSVRDWTQEKTLEGFGLSPCQDCHGRDRDCPTCNGEGFAKSASVEVCPSCHVTAAASRQFTAAVAEDEPPEEGHVHAPESAEAPEESGGDVEGAEEEPVPGKWDELLKKYPWAKIEQCPGCGQGHVECVHPHHGDNPPKFKLPNYPDDIFDPNDPHQPWKVDLNFPSHNPGHNMEKIMGPPQTMEDLPQEPEKLRDLEANGLEYHQRVKEPGAPITSERLFKHQTYEEAMDSHRGAIENGFESKLAPVQRRHFDPPKGLGKDMNDRKFQGSVEGVEGEYENDLVLSYLYENDPAEWAKLAQNLGCPNCGGVGSTPDGHVCPACFGTGHGGGLMLKGGLKVAALPWEEWECAGRCGKTNATSGDVDEHYAQGAYAGRYCPSCWRNASFLNKDEAGPPSSGDEDEDEYHRMNHYEDEDYRFGQVQAPEGAQVGILYGDDGTTYQSTDGGETWEKMGSHNRHAELGDDHKCELCNPAHLDHIKGKGENYANCPACRAWGSCPECTADFGTCEHTRLAAKKAATDDEKEEARKALNDALNDSVREEHENTPDLVKTMNCSECGKTYGWCQHTKISANEHTPDEEEEDDDIKLFKFDHGPGQGNDTTHSEIHQQEHTGAASDFDEEHMREQHGWPSHAIIRVDSVSPTLLQRTHDAEHEEGRTDRDFRPHTHGRTSAATSRGMVMADTQFSADEWKQVAFWERAKAQRVEHALIQVAPEKRMQLAHICNEDCQGPREAAIQRESITPTERMTGQGCGRCGETGHTSDRCPSNKGSNVQETGGTGRYLDYGDYQPKEAALDKELMMDPYELLDEELVLDPFEATSKTPVKPKKTKTPEEKAHDEAKAKAKQVVKKTEDVADKAVDVASFFTTPKHKHAQINPASGPAGTSEKDLVDNVGSGEHPVPVTLITDHKGEVAIGVEPATCRYCGKAMADHAQWNPTWNGPRVSRRSDYMNVPFAWRQDDPCPHCGEPALDETGRCDVCHSYADNTPRRGE